MKIERNGSINDLLEKLPTEVTKADIKDLTGISSSTLQAWEKKGLVTPHVLYSTGDVLASKLYDATQVARVMLIRALREDGWQFQEIRNELCKVCWLERNKKVIEDYFNGLSRRQ
jgi:hypothetical protein